MQPQENPARVLLGLHGNSSEMFFFKEPILFRVYVCMVTAADDESIITFTPLWYKSSQPREYDCVLFISYPI